MDSISVLVPAFNERENLAGTVREVIAATEAFEEMEVLILDDGSTDGTGELADELADRYPAVHVTHNPVNRGLGWNYRHGIAMARMRFIIFVNGKHDIASDQLEGIFKHRHEADIVVPYHTNQHERPLVRRLISRCFTVLLNRMFGLRIRYYNDAALYRAETLKRLQLRTDSYALQAEALIKAVKSGATFMEVPIVNLYDAPRRSSAFRLMNLYGVARFLVSTWKDVHGGGRAG